MQRGEKFCSNIRRSYVPPIQTAEDTKTTEDVFYPTSPGFRATLNMCIVGRRISHKDHEEEYIQKYMPNTWNTERRVVGRDY